MLSSRDGDGVSLTSRAGYAAKMASGTLTPYAAASKPTTTAKLPPAESPARMIRFADDPSNDEA